MSDDFLWALHDSFGLSSTPEEEACEAAEQLANAATAWLTGDPGHDLERSLERVELGLEAVPDRPERRVMESAVTLLREAYESDATSQSWQIVDMVREVAGCLAKAA